MQGSLSNDTTSVPMQSSQSEGHTTRRRKSQSLMYSGCGMRPFVIIANAAL